MHHIKSHRSLYESNHFLHFTYCKPLRLLVPPAKTTAEKPRALARKIRATQAKKLCFFSQGALHSFLTFSRF